MILSTDHLRSKSSSCSVLRLASSITTWRKQQPEKDSQSQMAACTRQIRRYNYN